MISNIPYQNKLYRFDFSEPIDISLPLKEGNINPNCYWAEPPKFETITSEGFVGSVAKGGSVNYQKLIITPHGNGTHTECLGHITAREQTINQTLNKFHFTAVLISVNPEKINNDQGITLKSVQQELGNNRPEAIVIRTLPNTEEKKTRQYSGTNPPYLHSDVTSWLREINIQHLLTDLPSVDKEIDGGQLAAHKAFWGVPDKPRNQCTITELVYVPDVVDDGLYLLNLQICSLEMDACPSKPVLYKMSEI